MTASHLDYIRYQERALRAVLTRYGLTDPSVAARGGGHATIYLVVVPDEHVELLDLIYAEDEVQELLGPAVEVVSAGSDLGRSLRPLAEAL
ncbi:hypothetical protein [Microbacterium nymphoidis]|uniref:hypothetical protein n=1 Tax=Microbacterium nymphoidis TaxID=2898586 RepID=UPI001E290C95|nr:hypothetical protein [Microbacterium nymphoidis]MCD2498500.1 hypothetical protein [Microbacterium nymphoidis]